MTALTADFSLALQAVSAPALVHGSDRILFANTAMERLLGYGLEALQQMSPHGWAAPEFADELQSYGHRCLAEEGELPAIEIEALTGSGSRRVLEVKAHRVMLHSQPCAVLTGQDLSDIRHVQTSLLDIGRVLYQIIENNPVATFVIDKSHRITQWNAACAQLTEREATDMMGRDDAWRAFYPEQRPLLADLILDGTVEQECERLYGRHCSRSPHLPDAYEVEGYFPNFGREGRWLFFTAAPLFDTHGQVVGAIETLQDVTRRREAERELRRHRTELETMVADRTAQLLSTHHELEAFLENASVGIISTANQQVQRGNRKFIEMFELGDVAPHGLPTRRLFKSDADYEALRWVARPVLSQGGSMLHETELCTLAGNSLWVQIIAYAADPADPEAGTWWLLQDRTEVRRVQQELELNYERIKQTNFRLEEAQNQLLQSEKMASIGQLAAGVAHEINNPIGFVSSNLGSLRGYVQPVFALLELLKKTPADELPGDVRAELDRVDAAVDLSFVQEDLPQLLDESEEGLSRVKKIVQDLKDFSRVDHADWQDADLNAGLDSTLNVVMNEVKYKAEIRKDYAVLPPVHCIAAQLNQVFMNLIVNAAHAIKERGTITLATRAEGDWVCIEVADTGSGMSEEVKRRIFEPFFTTKPVGQGTGLGLSLSFSIVQKHGGRIEVDSKPGVGTRFSVWIPVQPASTQP
ncbi:PAS domain S-box-containing protein [Pelomonas saccharophila]|uniref:histidine kinase n=1 Tax=Roseateles saccharophilus TaxID=304 RepID=A0ABU1YKD3_ROSSA|nr:ATP-binding protein [Roseateles saccharophilus]MDR7269320.1 PAS domain S-box-containing protein [Roseateles saccharophilus]